MGIRCFKNSILIGIICSVVSSRPNGGDGPGKQHFGCGNGQGGAQEKPPELPAVPRLVDLICSPFTWNQSDDTGLGEEGFKVFLIDPAQIGFCWIQAYGEPVGHPPT